jgi:hypothetical protein
MRWKRVAWLGCLAPVCGGCFPALHGAHALVAENAVASTEAGIERRISHHARQAWRAVRDQYPRKAFTPEFRDGFLDGYADYLDRGGDAQPPAAPPARYTTNKKYFTPEGHALIRDYFLGFQYGTEVAVATGQRQFLTVPVLVPDGDPILAGPPAEALAPTIPPAAVMPAPPVPLPLPRPAPTSDSPLVPRVPALPPAGPAVPPLPPQSSGIPGYHLPSWGNPAGNRRATALVQHTPAPAAPRPPVERPEPTGSKFSSFPIPVEVLASEPALPVIVPVAGSDPVPLPAAPPPRPEFDVKLPEPPTEVPSLPPHVPTPPMTDELPVLPPNFTVPPPLPANHTDPVRK